MEQAWVLRVVGASELASPDGHRTRLSSKPKCFGLLLFLALPTRGRRVRREVLLATFWPELDEQRARNALRTTLHQLRRILGPDAILGSGEDELSLDPAIVRVDFDELSQALASGDPSPWLSLPSLEIAPGLHVPDAAPFDEWLDAQRASLTGLLVRAASRSSQEAERAGDMPRSVVAARAAALFAPHDEIVQRRLLALLDQCGDRAGALKMFGHLQARLQLDFEATPAPETMALVRSIRDRTLAAPPALAPEAAHTNGGAPAPVSHETPIAAPPPPSAPRSHQRIGRQRALRTTGVMIVVLALIGAAVLGGDARDRASFDTVAASTPIAIPPFRNELRDSLARYLAPALGESVADEFPPSVVVPYGATRSVAEDSAGRRALHASGARSVLSGVLTGSASALRLELSLTTIDGHRIAGPMRLQGSERELMRLRDSIVALVTRASGSRRATRPRHVPDPAAYQLSLNAAWLLGRRSRDELLQSRALYTRALEIDPAWAELWLGLARVSGALAYRHYIDYRAGHRASEHAANEALKRAPDDGRALIERALARFQLGDFTGAEADARRATSLDTTDLHMQSLIGTWWQWSGDHLDSALAYTLRARRLAPWDRQTALNVLQIVGCMPDSTAIVGAARAVLDMDPNEPEALETLAWTETRFGRWDEATRLYERAHAGRVARAVGASARELRGEARFRATVRALQRDALDAARRGADAGPALLERRIAMFEDLGMRDSSLALMDGVVDSLGVHYANMMCAENLRGFRRDPRAIAIVRRRGWPMAEFDRRH